MSKQFSVQKAKKARTAGLNTQRRGDRFSFFSTPAVNAAATNMHTNTKISDPVEKELERHYHWPSDYPVKYQDDDHAIRIRYRVSNKQQCHETLSEIVTLYTDDAHWTWRTLNGSTTHPHLEEYLQQDPTGEKP